MALGFCMTLASNPFFAHILCLVSPSLEVEVGNVFGDLFSFKWGFCI